jgi:hypothetical protein
MTLTITQTLLAVGAFALLWAAGSFAAKAIIERGERRRRRAWDSFHAHTPRPAPARRHAAVPFDQDQWGNK